MGIPISEIDNHVDDHVDREIELCFDKASPTSFFTFAGAGSGKTRSLINTLVYLDKEMGADLLAYSKQVAIITYTNAACDEISRRLQYKSIFAVSTIHSFLWELIKNYQLDIKEWIRAEIMSDIADLEDKQSRGRAGAAQIERAERIEKNKARLAKLNTIKRFSYNPNGENFGHDSLNHAEVIKIGSEFIAKNETMQKILVSKYPILLIDESQDTKKELIDALLTLHENDKSGFIIGMFGDTMQKIYMDGKDNLAICIPDNWVKPTKVMNHRSASRIVDVANSIRKTIDGQRQRPRSDAERGTVRLFIVDSSANKPSIEHTVAKIMANETGDSEWLKSSERKSLILEHHMAATRLGFFNLYSPLNEIKSFDNALRDGTLPELSFLANTIRPLIIAHHDNQDFEISKILRQSSPLLDKRAFAVKNEKQSELIVAAEKAVNTLFSLWNKNKVPSCIDILQSVHKSGLFKLTDRMEETLVNPTKESSDEKISALRKALAAPFTQLELYDDYVSRNTQFATHQGIKGLEFPRVVVIIDDAESRGFLFSYEKLFGASPKTDTDLKNEREGKDTSIARTTRLFYVACTRAQKSLAVIAYTRDQDAVKKTAMSNGWFMENEIRPL